MKGPLQGIVCATLTPFKASEVEVDKNSLVNLVEYLIESGVDGLFVVGTNGEGVNMSLEMRSQIARLYVEAAKGRVPVVVHTGALTTRQTVELTKHASDIGAQAAASIVPFFYPLDSNAIVYHYKQLASAARGFPHYIYNIPNLTGQNISPESISTLINEHNNFVGLKISTENFLSFFRYIETLPDLSIFIGCDQLLLPALLAGGRGTVSGAANCFPELFASFYEAYKNRDYQTAKKIQILIGSVSRILTGFSELSTMKFLLKKKGIFRFDTMISPLRSLMPKEGEMVVEGLKSIIGTI
jgi:dihydrodipicolinate synthase/N-acetylneuraminate lyase